MNALSVKKLATLALVGAIFGCVVPARAGDKIVFSDDKPKGDPTAALKGANELFQSKSWKLDQPGFDYNLLGIPSIPRNMPLDKGEQRRMDAIRTERKNWLMIAPGELQKKEEDRKSLGVANRPLDDLDSDRSTKDYTFTDPQEKNSSQRRQPGELRPIGQNSSKEDADARSQQEQLNKLRDEAEAESKRDKVFSLTPSAKEQQFGAHTASELNFNNLLNPNKTAIAEANGGISGDSSTFTLKDVAADPSRTKEQRARMEDFQKMMNAPLSSGASFGMVNPMSQSLSGAGSPFSSGGAVFNPNTAPANIPNRLAPPGLPSIGPATGPSYSGGSPFQQPAAQDSSRNWTRPTQELPHRRF